MRTRNGNRANVPQAAAASPAHSPVNENVLDPAAAIADQQCEVEDDDQLLDDAVLSRLQSAGEVKSLSDAAAKLSRSAGHQTRRVSRVDTALKPRKSKAKKHRVERMGFTIALLPDGVSSYDTGSATQSAQSFLQSSASRQPRGFRR